MSVSTKALPPIESPESSAPIITRAVAAALAGRFIETYPVPGWQRAALSLLGRLPSAAGRAVISHFEAVSGLPPERLAGLDVNDLAARRLEDYAGLPGPFPAVTFGAGLGGATAHLALALGGPFLPQAFVTTLKGGAPDADIQTYFQRSAGLAQAVARNNPNVLTIQHFDPVHDEWMTHYVNHLRFKLLDLPEAYQAYIQEHLEPGGAVVYLDCEAQWLRYRVGERVVFQVGGWGDLSPEEFLNGSTRLEAYCRQRGLKQCGWKLPAFPLERGPESEWGSEPGPGAALEAFCRNNGYRFVPVRLPAGHDYSMLAYRAVQRLLEKEGRQPAGVLIEMFSQFDAAAVMQAGLLPVWLIFNTWDSLAFLKEMVPLFPEQGPVFFSPLATFTLTPDLAPWSEWEAALQGLAWFNVGARASHYPGDARAVVDWARPLHEWVRRNRRPIESVLTAEELLALVETSEQNPREN